MQYKKLHIEIKNQVAYLLLDAKSPFEKPSVTTIREINQAMAQPVADPETAVLVISGYPGDSFTAGADIGQMLHFTPQDAFHFSEFGQSLFSQIKASCKPVIATPNSITMGGACDLAQATKSGMTTGFCGTKNCRDRLEKIQL